MKTSNDPRHKKRQITVQELFSLQFHKQKVTRDTQEIIDNKEKIDKHIEISATDYPVEKINRIDLAILRLAVYEILINQKAPQNVIIDEAVELAKEFGNESSPGFINGVLGKIIKLYGKSTKTKKS